MKMRLISLTLMFATSAALAQAPQAVPAGPPPDVPIEIMAPPPEAGALPVLQAQVVEQGPGPGLDRVFIARSFFADSKPVTGAPYSATQVTESKQTLSDGTHIDRTITRQIARDSQGRVRIEMSISGPLGASSQEPAKTIISISDPVAGKAYSLRPDKKTAFVHDFPKQMGLPPISRDKIYQRRNSSSNVNTEDLGAQTMDGITAQGNRTTITIATGQIGNDRPITTVIETWYSPDLHVNVLQKRNDPRFGETITKLTNIQQAEPDASLFTVPSDYTLRQDRDKPGMFLRTGPLK